MHATLLYIFVLVRSYILVGSCDLFTHMDVSKYCIYHISSFSWKSDIRTRFSWEPQSNIFTKWLTFPQNNSAITWTTKPSTFDHNFPLDIFLSKMLHVITISSVEIYVTINRIIRSHNFYKAHIRVYFVLLFIKDSLAQSSAITECTACH